MTSDGSSVASSMSGEHVSLIDDEVSEPPPDENRPLFVRMGACAFFFLSLLGLALAWGSFCAAGLLYIHDHSPSREEITAILTPEKQMPFYLKFLTGMIGAVCSAMILGSPTKPQDATSTHSTTGVLKAVAKRAYTVLLLGSFLYSWWGELQVIQAVTAKEHALPSSFTPARSVEVSGWFPRALRMLMLAELQTATGSNVNKLADTVAILMAYHERLNFVGVHDRNLLQRWITAAEAMGTPMEDFRPWNEGLFHVTVIHPRRLAFLLEELSKINGFVFKFYASLLFLRFMTPFFVFAGVYFTFSVVAYPWLVILGCGALTVWMRLVVVVPLMSTFKKKPDDETATPSTITYSGITHETFGTDPEGERHLRAAFDALACPWVLPGGLERRIPGVLFIGERAVRSWTPQETRENYNEELRLLSVTGLTRDGWFFIIGGSTMFKFGFDIITTMITRFFVGGGYLESVTTTLTERHWNAWIAQYPETAKMACDVFFQMF